MAYVGSGIGADIDFSTDSGGGGSDTSSSSADTSSSKEFDIDWTSLKDPAKFRDELKTKSQSAIEAGAPKAAAGLCAMVGAAAASPACMAAGKAVAKPIAKFVGKAIDTVYDGIMSIGKKRRKPPILITSADVRALSPVEQEYYDLMAQAAWLYLDNMIAYDTALTVIAQKQQELLPGSTPWPPNFIAKALQQRGVSLVPSVLNDRRQWSPDFLAADIPDVKMNIGVWEVRAAIFDQGAFRQWESESRAWGATHALVPPYLPDTLRQIEALQRPMEQKVLLLRALVGTAQKWSLTLEGASAQVLTSLAQNATDLAVQKEMMPALRAQLAAERAQAAAAADARMMPTEAAVGGSSGKAWLVGAVLVGAGVLWASSRKS